MSNTIQSCFRTLEIETAQFRCTCIYYDSQFRSFINNTNI